jgi:hypothetical protein
MIKDIHPLTVKALLAALKDMPEDTPVVIDTLVPGQTHIHEYRPLTDARHIEVKGGFRVVLR